MTEFWNGTTWSIVASPSIRPGTDDNALLGVSCVSPTACTAVGQYFFGLGHSGPLIESWNGTRWIIVPSPNRRDTGGLRGVSCASLTACVAVGTYLGYLAVNRTLTESWNGTRWAAVPTPNAGPADYYNNPVAVACASARACMVAGNYGNYGLGGLSKTLTMIGTYGS